MYDTCWTVAQETAHSFGLDHEYQFTDGQLGVQRSDDVSHRLRRREVLPQQARRVRRVRRRARASAAACRTRSRKLTKVLGAGTSIDPGADVDDPDAGRGHASPRASSCTRAPPARGAASRRSRCGSTITVGDRRRAPRSARTVSRIRRLHADRTGERARRRDRPRRRRRTTTSTLETDSARPSPCTKGAPCTSAACVPDRSEVRRGQVLLGSADRRAR